MEAKSNEHHRAIEAKDKSYKVMLDIARKPSGGRNLEWIIVLYTCTRYDILNCPIL